MSEFIIMVIFYGICKVRLYAKLIKFSRNFFLKSNWKNTEFHFLNLEFHFKLMNRKFNFYDMLEL